MHAVSNRHLVPLYILVCPWGTHFGGGLCHRIGGRSRYMNNCELCTFAERLGTYRVL